MKKETIIISSVDDYIATYPAPVRSLLEKMRKAIKTAAPGAEEVLSYQMPSYKYHGRLVYFAAHTKHIGFYPFKTAINAFKKELKDFEGAPGTVRFPFDKPLPLELIKRMVKFRVKENLEKLNAKKSIK